MYRVGIDLGGTNIAAGIVDEENNLLHTSSIPTMLPRNAEELAESIAAFVYRILEEAGIPLCQIVSAGIGIPGTVNPQTSMVEYANNLGFSHVPFGKLLGLCFPFPLYSANDAKAAAWGEYLTGAGAGCSSMVMITLGTGIGGAIILDGRLVDGYNFAAGEVGHMVIRKNGKACTCGRKGCFEAYASATALVSSARAAALKEPASLLYTRSHGEVKAIDGRAVFHAAQEGDVTASKVLERFLSDLADGVANLINIFQPEILCIGGGLSGAGESLLAPLREMAAPLLYSRASEINTRIVSAGLGNNAGIIGAALLKC